MNRVEPWWKSESTDDVISGPKILSAWNEGLFGKAEPSPSQIQSLADLTQRLWTQFNTDRQSLDRDYMSDEKLLSAYLASFFLPNIERTRNILTNRRISEIINKLTQLNEIQILDFGSGPLSASFGFMIALNQIKQNFNQDQFNLKKVKIIAVERSEKAVKRAEAFMKRSLSEKIEVEITRTTSVPKQTSFQVILAANVLNEIPEKHHVKTMNQLLATLDNSFDNIAVIIEPGQELHSKNLTLLRDEVLIQNELNDFKIIAPCPHSLGCPLSPKQGRADWCWFKSVFTAPPALQLLDQKSQLEHSNLAYSYIALHKQRAEAHTLNNEIAAICVSDEMSVGHERDSEKRSTFFKNNLLESSKKTDSTQIEQIARAGQKTKLCSQSGAYLGGLRTRMEPERAIRRGEELQSFDVFQAVIKER